MSSNRFPGVPVVLALVVACTLTAMVAGCGNKSASAWSPLKVSKASTAAPGASKTSADASATKPAPKIPNIAAPDTLQPPSYVGFEPLPSFTYHHVDPKLKNEIAIRPATFEAQLKILSNLGYHTITARQLVDHQTKGTPLPDKPVMITFDDGWRNQYTYAWPLLKKYGFTATFFINPQPISAGYRGYMTRDMVVTLHKAGNDIESHTWRHLTLTRTRKVTAEKFQKRYFSELTKTDDWIRKVVGVAPVAISYPYGYYDLETVGMVQAAGYKAGFSVDEAVADARAWDAFQMKRFTITRAETADSFRRRLLSGPLPVSDIEPSPGTRVVGVNTTVTVDITDVPANITGITLRGGPSMRRMQIVARDGRKYAVGVIRGGKTGFRAISMTASGPDGRKYYASWGIETGDIAR